MNLTLPDKWADIQAFDLDPVGDLMCFRRSIPPSFVMEMMREFKRYAYLACVKDRPPIGMASNWVDEFWHMFLLDTPMYRNFEKTLGRELNHNPVRWDVTEKDKSIAIERHHAAAILYLKEFGHRPPNRLWCNVPESLTEPDNLPGTVSGDALALTPDKGEIPLSELRPGNIVIGCGGGESEIQSVSAWPISLQDVLGYVGKPWWFAANVLIWVNPKKTVTLDPDSLVDTTEYPMSLSNGIFHLHLTAPDEPLMKWPANGTEARQPHPNTLGYTFAATRGLRIKGGFDWHTPNLEDLNP